MREETEKERKARETEELRRYNERLGPGVKLDDAIDSNDVRHFGRGWTKEDKKEIKRKQAEKRKN